MPRLRPLAGLLTFIWIAACGDDDASPDAGADPTDDAAPTPRCDPAKEFEAPVALAELASAGSDFGARLSPDELTVYFTRQDGAARARVFMATRDSLDEPFSGVQPVPGLGRIAEQGESMPSVTRDGLIVYVAVLSPTTQGHDIHTAFRTGVDADFEPTSAVPALATGLNEYAPYLSGSTMYFQAGETTGGAQIYSSILSPTGFRAPEPVLGLAAEGATDTSPVLSRDQLTLYFASDRAGDEPTATDVWVARRRGNNQAFEPPALVEALSSPAIDRPSWLSDDGCVLYLDSARGTSLDIHVARRPL